MSFCEMSFFQMYFDEMYFYTVFKFCPSFLVTGSRSTFNYRAGLTFPVLVCTVPSFMDRTSRCNKVDAVQLYTSYRLNLLLLKGQICV